MDRFDIFGTIDFYKNFSNVSKVKKKIISSDILSADLIISFRLIWELDQIKW